MPRPSLRPSLRQSQSPNPSLAAAVCLLLAAPAAAQQALPGPIAAFAAERSAECAALGGAPQIGPAFATAVDLTGDGTPDYILDLAGIECANAWSAFCGSAGCPVSVWIARPEGLRREWGDYAQGWSIDTQGAEMAVVVERHGAACPGSSSGADGCSERLTFAAAPDPAPDPAAPPPAEGAAAVAAAPEPDAPDLAVPDPDLPDAPETPAAPAEALAAPGVEGWTLRAAPGGSPVAVSDGPGGIATVAVFCLAGQPWLAASPRAPLDAETAELRFAFAGDSVAVTAPREDSAGGALVVDLAGRPLAGLLAGRDSSVRVSLDGVEQGVLSLRGSTRAIRGALASCAAL